MTLARWIVVALAGSGLACGTAGMKGPPRSLSTSPVPRAVLVDLVRAEDARTVGPGVETAAASDDPAVRARVALTLGRIGTDPAIALLDDLASDPVASVRAAAVRGRALVRGRGPGDAIAAMGDPAAEVRAAAADALGLSAAADAAGHLVDLLADPDADVRSRAAIAAGRVRATRASVQALTDAVVDEATAVRDAAIDSLSSIARPGSSAGDGDDGFAVRSLARRRLVALADDPSSEVRARVARGLRIPTSEEEAAVLRVLARDPVPEVRVHAIGSLAFPGSPGIALAREWFADPDTAVHAASFDALGKIGGNDAYRAAAAGIAKHVEVAWLVPYAVRGLVESRPRQGLPEAALRFARASDPRIREALCEAIASTGTQDVGFTVQRVIGEMAVADVPSVRQDAVRALGSWGGPLSELPVPGPSDGDPRVRVGLAETARARLSAVSRSESADGGDRARDALDLLASIEPPWSPDPDTSVASVAAWIDAVAASPDERAEAFLDRAVAAPVAPALRERARAARGDASPVPGPAGGTAVDADAIARWASRPRAAIVTVAREGFLPARFVVALDVDTAPMATWRFARDVEDGRFDGVAFDGYRPGHRIRVGDPEDRRFDRSDRLVRPEPAFGDLPAGSIVALPPGEGRAVGPWAILLEARPDLLGRVTRIGRIVQNLAGVARLVRPDDRIVSVEIYEGDGTEPLPPPPRVAGDLGG